MISARKRPRSKASPTAVTKVEAEIAKLTVCYAVATDAIGRRDFQKGKELYQTCFTPDAVISVFFPNAANDFTRQPDMTKIGPEEWGEFVASVFSNNQYMATQHLIGSINIDVRGDVAAMTSYLHATHKRSDTSIDVANGVYEDEVVRNRGHWQIRRRTLKLITFLTLSSPPAERRRSPPPHGRPATG